MTSKEIDSVIEQSGMSTLVRKGTQYKSFSRHQMVELVHKLREENNALRAQVGKTQDHIPRERIFHCMYVCAVILKQLKPKKDMPIIFRNIDMAIALTFMHFNDKDFVTSEQFLAYCRKLLIPLTHKPEFILKWLVKTHLADAIDAKGKSHYYITSLGRQIAEDINYIRLQLPQVKAKARMSKILWGKKRSSFTG